MFYKIHIINIVCIVIVGIILTVLTYTVSQRGLIKCIGAKFHIALVVLFSLGIAACFTVLGFEICMLMTSLTGGV